MENENNENLDSQNEEKIETSETNEENIDSLKEKMTDLEEKNKQLFERAKKAETELKGSKEAEEKTSEKPKEKSDDNLLERLDTMALKIAGIKEADEVELFNKWKEQTGREADDIVGNEIFTKELEDLRTARANLEATSDVKGEGDKSGGAKDNPDYWIAKATKGDDGKLRFPDETPKELYSKILDKMAASEPNSSGNLQFYNE